MTFKERIYAVLSVDSQLLSLWGGLFLYKDAAPQNLRDAVVGAVEFTYTVYRDLPVSPFQALDPSPLGLNSRRFAFETFSTDRYPAGAGADMAEAISTRITNVLRTLAEPGGVEAVYPEGMTSFFHTEQRCSVNVKNFLFHTALD